MKLNIGGRRFITTKSTVSQLGNNLLTTLLSHQENNTLEVRVDEKGFIYIDRNGDVREQGWFINSPDLFLGSRLFEDRRTGDVPFLLLGSDSQGARFVTYLSHIIY